MRLPFIRRPAPLSPLRSLDAYARWAAAYPPHAHNAFMQAEEAAMRGLLPPMTGRVMLDLAGGTGRYGLLAREAGAAQVIELDNSREMLARNPLALRALAPMAAIPLASETVDGVICALAVGHVTDIVPVFGEIGRVMRRGGWALVSDMHPFVALSGQARTFIDAEGRVFAVEHHIHLYSAVQAAAEAAGLYIDAVREPSVAGAPAAHLPALIVYRLRKGQIGG